MANQERYLNYKDFETMLIAPKAYLAAHPSHCTHFHTCVPYEDIARFIPEFGRGENG